MLAVALYPSLFRREPARGACRKNVSVSVRSYYKFLPGVRSYLFPPTPYTIHRTPYTCFLCLCLLKGCLPLRGEGSLWRAVVSLLTALLTGRALIALLTLQPFKRVLYVFFYKSALEIIVPLAAKKLHISPTTYTVHHTLYTIHHTPVFYVYCF